MNLCKNKLGQSLVELVMSIAVIEIGLFSVWSLFLVNFNAEREAELRIVGVNLAREGVEVIKNIRDSNWVKSANNEKIGTRIITWDETLAPGEYSINFDSQIPEDKSRENLYLNSTGNFTNENQNNAISPFSRKIILKNICCQDDNGDLKCDTTNFETTDSTDDCPLKIGVNVVSIVSWQISGHQRNATLEDNLYDWK